MRSCKWLLVTVLALLVPACAGPADAPSQRESITVLASWTGQEEAQFRALAAEFERKYGFRFRVDYQGTRALEQVLLADVQKGAPPDIAIVPSPAELQRYADAPLDQPRLVELPMTYGNEGPLPYAIFWEWVQGLGNAEKRFAVVAKADLKSIVWYRRNGAPIQPESWAEMLALGRASGGWCLGMGAPPVSGWPGTDWIEDILLKKYGPVDYTEFAQGRMRWTDEKMKTVWRDGGEVLADSRSGAPAALLTDFSDAGRGMFEQPQRCSLDHAGSFLKSQYQATRPDGTAPVAGKDFDFFRFPPLSQPSIVSADLAVMFNDSPGANAFMQFLASTEGQRILAGHREGSVYSINRNFLGGRLYADRPGGDVDLRIAEEIGQSGRGLCFDASDLMPATMRSAFYRAVLEFVRAPERLNEILNQLEDVRRRLAGPPPVESWARFACVGPNP
ncbi:ABC transporter substrate-binding protein [Saccharopolyspora phatthalungensis]|uniref:Alpha-glucoside transport system substrate-binding protein n=1 Tax=Saccharopolyspora phatthalungensis TaxID=664693 RepID=A0A840Q8A5_9PSEU|nr:ABC transporter substrate-binding protein [Saccharopolyspora phatthalungensis]MBB5156167.1 alpha-glucoside transport system substrate-binding protein [Saccharopolyspora phatthalungensis]